MASVWRLSVVPLTLMFGLCGCDDYSANGGDDAARAGEKPERDEMSGNPGDASAGAPADSMDETDPADSMGGTAGAPMKPEGPADPTDGTEDAFSAPDAAASDAPAAVRDAAADDATAPGFTDAEWELLRTLAPPELPPPPPDVSNRFADDAAAAALGEKLFFDPGFSGKMLDLDNDGSSRTLGVRGQSGKVACAGCHSAETGFLDDRSPFKELSLGTGWTGRRTPSLLDVGQASIVMWGGRHSTLHSQVFGALENPLEMNSSRLFLAQWIAQNYAAEYETLFGEGTLAPITDTQRFPPLSADTTGCSLTEDIDHPRALPPDPLYDCHGFPGDDAEYDALAPSDQELVTRIVVNAGKAIGAYERLLTCGTGRFDAWVRGDADALDASEQNGAKLFIGKAGCVSCHSGPYFSDQQFYALGLEEKATRSRIFNGNDRGAALDLPKAAADPLGVNGDYSDGNDGRLPADLEVDAEHEGAFRTPVLRCVGKRPSFMHSGLLLTLEEVVAFFDRGGDTPGTYVGTSVLTPLDLSDVERADLVAFLRTLDGDAPVPTFR
jgi:cytochrome c peroxidase